MNSSWTARQYTLQIVAVDPAGNAVATAPQTLTFVDAFENPVAGAFKFFIQTDDGTEDGEAKHKSTVHAGQKFELNITALDTELSTDDEDVRAVTYRGKTRISIVVPEGDEDKLAGIKFSEGVSVLEDDAGKGIGYLDASGWKAGNRDDVYFTSDKAIDDATVMLENVDGDEVKFSAKLEGVKVVAAQFGAFEIVALDPDPTETVSGAFQLKVTATDTFGNESMKKSGAADAKLHESLKVTFSSNSTKVRVPPGTQLIDESGTATVGADAEDVSTTVKIGVSWDDGEATGSLTLTVVGAVVEVPGAPAAPASLIVQDYKGPSGGGDQGGMVMVSFPNSADHATVGKYQIFREMAVTTSLDTAGNLAESEEATMEWVPWAALELEDPNADVQRAVIPALDNVATLWAVAAIGTGGASGETPSADSAPAGKRVFTKESVQQTLELLGMAPEALLTDDELMNQFNAPEDYVKSILGDQKNLVFAPVNPDVSVLMGNGSTPSNIRTSGHPQQASARRATEEPVGATDDIAPAGATDAAGALSSDGGAAQVALSWKVSADEGIVGFIPYRGYSVPIYGVKGYKVLRGTSEDALESIGSVGAGSTEFVDSNLPEDARAIIYRIDAFDDNNDTPSQLVTIQNVEVRAKFADADGPVYIIALDGSTPLTVDFEDFIAFAAAFGSQKGDENYNIQADVNDDGMVNFADFIIASGSFGRTAQAPASKLAVVPQRPGVNADTEMKLELASEKVLVGETISVTVSMANAQALNGYGLELMYDADKFEFVSAVSAENDLLKSEGGETPLFKNWADEGRVSVVNAIIGSGSVGGEGALVTFTFKVLREFEDSARFEIAQGVVFDPERLANPVVMLGAPGRAEHADGVRAASELPEPVQPANQHSVRPG